MKLQFIKLKLDWHSELPLENLRQFIIESLNVHGDPLRWSITSIERSLMKKKIKLIVIEAVVIIPDSL